MLDSTVGAAMIFFASCLCLHTCINIFYLSPSILRYDMHLFFVCLHLLLYDMHLLWYDVHIFYAFVRQILVAASWLPFSYFIYVRVTSFEWTLILMTSLFQLTGVAVFTNAYPNPFPKVFGYHEVFHIFVVLAGICVYLINWSIIRRTCNIYDRHTDVIDALWRLISNQSGFFV